MSLLESFSYRTSKLKVLFLLVVVVVSLFFSDRELRFSHYVEVSPLLIYTLLFATSSVVLLSNKRVYIDLISVILTVRLVLYLIPVFYTRNLGGFWGNYFSVIASFVAYLVASQSHNKENAHNARKVSNILLSYLTLASMQVIYLFFLLTNQYGQLSIGLFKYNMVTPVGASNFISSILVPLIVFVYFIDIDRRLKVISLLTAVVAVVVIQSRTAILVLIILSSMELVRIYRKKIRLVRDRSAFSVFIIVTTIALLIAIITIAYIIFNHFIGSGDMGLTYTGSSIYGALNALTSGRLDVYSIELNRWADSFLFGQGLARQVGDMRSHNWVIDLLVHSGVLGLAFFLVAIFWWIKRVQNYKVVSASVRAAHWAVISILIQGLSEVSIFTVPMDILLWYLVGYSIAEVNQIRIKNKLLRRKVIESL